jgi:predicted transcriptional regulator
MKEQVADIVAAYVGHNKISSDQLPALISTVNEALSALGQPGIAAPETPSPAVPIRRALGTDKITCLNCGWSGQMLKRHLHTAHSLEPKAYRDRWKLAPDYPMTAPSYAVRRSELAKTIGLGRRGGTRD